MNNYLQSTRKIGNLLYEKVILGHCFNPNNKIRLVIMTLLLGSVLYFSFKLESIPIFSLLEVLSLMWLIILWFDFGYRYGTSKSIPLWSLLLSIAIMSFVSFVAPIVLGAAFGNYIYRMRLIKRKPMLFLIVLFGVIFSFYLYRWVLISIILGMRGIID